MGGVTIVMELGDWLLGKCLSIASTQLLLFLQFCIYLCSKSKENQVSPCRVDIPGGYGRVKQICSGADHTYALTDSGKLIGWGGDDTGVLCRRTLSRHKLNVLIPRRVDFKSAPRKDNLVKLVCTGAYHTFAIMENGHVYSWGNNGSGSST